LIKEDLIKSHPFLKFNDVDIIPHGFDPADFEDIVPLEKETHKLIITYSGIFYEGITPKFLLKAFKKLTLENPDIALNIKLQFIGHFKKENHKIVTKLKLENFVEDVGYLSHKEALTRLISSDILWIMLPQGDRMFNVTPGKIFEYFGTKKPIIANLPEGISKNLIKEYGASFITKPNDVDEIKNTLLKCHELYLKGKLPKPNDEFVNRYNRINLTEQLVKIFQFYLKTE
ncbi:MAG: glycosyl transferase family 1, partial [Ignavibacteriae bacterium]|nr:glycosyl transferase family 1 [Ignavibacteriota bacterium]